jgi:predicted regulator of Ras-like GTPase activity (Roadblock/LC7/MglB family)
VSAPSGAVSSPFGQILREAVEAVPGALAGVFAAADGEPVDAYPAEEERWPLVAAHYGVVLASVQAALHTLHYGEAEALVIRHPRLIVLLEAVREGYFAMLGVAPPIHLATALDVLARAASKLREEMA